MIRFCSPVLTLALDERGQAPELSVPGIGNLIREPRPFARLEYFEPQPAFTNEWVHPLHVEEPVCVNCSAACPIPGGFALSFDGGVRAEFAVETHEDALLLVLRKLESPGALPARFRFAWMALRTDLDAAATGLAMDPVTEGGTLPGITEEQWAFSYEHTGYEGRRWALTAAPKSELRRRIQDVLRHHGRDIPVTSAGGPFAADCRKVQGSYMMVYGAYLDGSLTPQNLEEFIRILHSIGLTQVDFHGAEGKNFTFGDFEPNREIYPEGRRSLAQVVARLHEEGIDSILQTYAALIGDTSSLVHPVPDPGLGYNRLFTLMEDIDPDTDEIPIAEDTSDISLVLTGNYNSSTYVVWDDEIIQFTALGAHSLRGCVRGALGTRPAAHKAGTPGRNLKRKCNILVSDIGGPLFDHVARETAACINECGFDGCYLDALEAVNALEGWDFMHYWATRFAYAVTRYTQRPIGMEMSIMNHNLWYVRSRMGAWDRPARAHKAYLERHAEVNRLAQERFLIPQNLGWWYFGRNLPSAPPRWERITTDVYDTMGRLAAAHDFSLSFQGLTVQDYRGSTELQRCGDRVRRWEELRLSGRLSPGHHAALARGECRMTQDAVYPAAYPECIAVVRGGEAQVTLDNPYGAQQPFLLRLEPLQSRSACSGKTESVFDINDMVSGDGRRSGFSRTSSAVLGRPLDGIRAADLLTFHSRSVTGTVSDSDSPHGPALTLRARAGKNLGVVRFERRFEVPLNIGEQYGCGVWICGDGKGEIVNLQLRSPRLYSAGLDERIIRIDFTGWRYFELIESSSSLSMQYLWPYYHRQLDRDGEFVPEQYEAQTSEWPDSMYLTNMFVTGNPYHLTAANVDLSRVGAAAVWLNNLPAGEDVCVTIADWHTFYTHGTAFGDITLTDAHAHDVRVQGALPQDSVAEYSDGCGTPGLGRPGIPAASWYTSGAASMPVPEVRAEGMIELCPGPNTLRLRADAPDGSRLRVVCGVREDTPLFTAEDLL